MAFDPNAFLSATEAAGFSRAEVENIARHTGMDYAGLAKAGMAYLADRRAGLSANAQAANSPGSGGVPQGGFQSVYGYSPTTGKFVGNLGGPGYGAGQSSSSVLTGRDFNPMNTFAPAAFTQTFDPDSWMMGPPKKVGGLGGLGGLGGSGWSGMSQNSPVYRANNQPQNSGNYPWTNGPFRQTF